MHQLSKEQQTSTVISELDININQPSNKEKTDSQYLIVSISVLLSAILISASLFYNTRLTLKKLNELVEIGQQTQTIIATLPVGQAGAGVAPKQDLNTAVKVPGRADAPTLGSKNAKVVIYEFSDIQCPFCQRFFSQTFAKLKSEYIDTGKVKFIFRHLPLVSIHSNAQKAAEALECASRQGKFENYHDLVFSKSQADGTGLAVSDLKSYADSLGLNKGALGFGKDKFNACLDKSETAEVVKKDISDAALAGATGTPSFFVNGKKLAGAVPFESFKTIIDEELKK